MDWTFPRLERFLQCLPRRVRHTLEFRDPSWSRAETLELLLRHGVALCLHGQRSSGADVYAYFNNDVGGDAPRNTVTSRRFLEVRS
jgi:uncharacterized protein YecE (DUF72 family)